MSWGTPALYKRPSHKINYGNKPVELFKLHLDNSLRDRDRPHLPNGLHYKKAISDYLREIGKVRKITNHFNFYF